MTSLFQNQPLQNQQQQQQILNQQLNNNDPQNQMKITQNLIEKIQNNYNLLNRNNEDNLFKESTRENMKLNLNALQNFIPKNLIISTKRIDQIYALKTN